MMNDDLRVNLTRWAWGIKLPRDQKLLLLAICWHTDQFGLPPPSETLHELTGMSDENIWSIVTILDKKRLLTDYTNLVLDNALACETMQ